MKVSRYGKGLDAEELRRIAEGTSATARGAGERETTLPSAAPPSPLTQGRPDNGAPLDDTGLQDAPDAEHVALEAAFRQAAEGNAQGAGDAPPMGESGADSARAGVWGLHGAPRDAATEGQTLHTIGKEDVARGRELLEKYRSGKHNLEQRIVEDEQWYELRHWDVLRRAEKNHNAPEPTSAWLFNAIINKHADAMDNYPVPVVLPRETSDAESASTLSAVLPVVMEYNEFEKTYAENWWEKLKHGTGVYGVFWNPRKENGLGDVDIRAIDLLKIYWEPGVTDVQSSSNLFILEVADAEACAAEYPEFEGKFGMDTTQIKQYVHDDTIDLSGKCVVVDWYYKVRMPDGRTVLHYIKFSGDCLLYASQNDPAMQETGFYAHGKYPVVFDRLFPAKGTPAGWGYVSLCKDPQLYIDKLSANILENSMMATKKRFFVSRNAAVNMDQLLDWDKPIVDVEGEISDARIKEIMVRPLDQIYYTVLNGKIEEMKETAANRDVNSGGAGSGVTAAAAIAALQEAGNKISRDMIAASYRAYSEVAGLIVELIRQFYDESRAFRVTGSDAAARFVELGNADIGERPVGKDSSGATLYRVPIFDLKIKAQKKNPFSRMEQNELAKELYRLGFFNPDKAQEAIGALELMDFEGIDKVRESISSGQTMMKMCEQMQQEIAQMQAMLQGMVGGGRQGAPAPVGEGAPVGTPDPSGGGGPSETKTPVGGAARPLTDGVMKAVQPMTGYGERLAKRSVPDMG